MEFKSWLSESTVVDMAEFKSWFSGSKVVDNNGHPLMVYRGNSGGNTSDEGNWIRGNIIFTNNPRLASYYAKVDGKNFYKDPNQLTVDDGFHRAYLALKNPLVVDADNAGWDEIPVPEKHKEDIWTIHGTIQIDLLAKYAKKLGYDGLIAKNVIDQWGDGDQYVAFDVNQIRYV